MMAGLREMSLGCEEFVGSGIWEIEANVLGNSREMGVAMC
jgi:hypothetical protein